jgi:hypothetical protein
MPQRDRTGPLGGGPRTGLGLGDCRDTDGTRNGFWIAASLAGAVALELTRKDSVVRELAGSAFRSLKGELAKRLPGSRTAWERIDSTDSRSTQTEGR